MSLLAEEIENYFRDGQRFGVEIAYSFEGRIEDGELIGDALGSAGGLKKIQENTKFPAVKAKTISTLFNINDKGSLGKRIEEICQEADKAISEGYTIIVLSDRGVDKNHSYIPSLLSVGAVHHYLIRKRIIKKLLKNVLIY